MDLQKHYKGRIVVVTGATSGNGWALAHRLHALGAEVVGIGRNHEKLEALRNAGITGLRCDLGDPDQIGALLGRLKARSIDDVFHLAGTAAFGDLSPEERTAFEWSDLHGPVCLLEGLLPQVRPFGTVGVITSASVGLGEIPALAEYQRVKRGMVEWWRAKRPFYTSHGVNLMLISMGFVGTDIWNRAPGFPRWAGRLIQRAIPTPGSCTDRILTDAAEGASVSYPGWLADRLRVNSAGYFAPDPLLWEGATLLGRTTLPALLKLGRHDHG